MHLVTLPAVGQGSWYMGDNPATADAERNALLAGIQAGMTLIDTAEMYGNGRSERLVGSALQVAFQTGLACREDLFIVDKVLPQHADRAQMEDTCKDSLERLGLEYLDLYLLHWRGSIPLKETVYGMRKLQEAGLIKHWGVSNFDLEDMKELWRIPEARDCMVNQVLYHPASRGIEYELLPWMRVHDVTLMAYCPLAQGGSLSQRLFTNPVIKRIAAAHEVSPAAVILAFDIRDGHTLAIPKASQSAHTLQNAQALNLELSAHELEALGREFPAPHHRVPLDVQ